MRDCGFDRNNKVQDFERLPKGAYILKILAVKYEEGENSNSDKLRLQVDVAEGDYKDFYKKQYEADTREDKKWRGVFEIWCPKNDGTEKDSWTKKTFDTCLAAVEDSNPGFRFDGVHEETLKGKLVGGIVYREDYEKDGKVYEYYKFNRRLIDIQKIKDGTVKFPKDKILEQPKEGSSVAVGGFSDAPTGDSADLPF